MAFTVGQIVELLDAQWRDPEFQNGDRGTIMELVPMRVAPVTVLWHRIGREVFMPEYTLRIYVPGVSSVNVLLALQTVLREEQPHAVTELRRDLAEARGTLSAVRGTNADLREEVAHASREYGALWREHRDLLNRRNSVMGTLAQWRRAASDVLRSHAGESDQVYRALDSAATVVGTAITELMDGDIVEDADDDADEDDADDDEDADIVED